MAGVRAQVVDVVSSFLGREPTESEEDDKEEAENLRCLLDFLKTCIEHESSGAAQAANFGALLDTPEGGFCDVPLLTSAILQVPVILLLLSNGIYEAAFVIGKTPIAGLRLVWTSDPRAMALLDFWQQSMCRIAFINRLMFVYFVEMWFEIGFKSFQIDFVRSCSRVPLSRIVSNR